MELKQEVKDREYNKFGTTARKFAFEDMREEGMQTFYNSLYSYRRLKADFTYDLDNNKDIIVDFPDGIIEIEYEYVTKSEHLANYNSWNYWSDRVDADETEEEKKNNEKLINARKKKQEKIKRIERQKDSNCRISNRNKARHNQIITFINKRGIGAGKKRVLVFFDDSLYSVNNELFNFMQSLKLPLNNEIEYTYANEHAIRPFRIKWSDIKEFNTIIPKVVWQSYDKWVFESYNRIVLCSQRDFQDEETLRMVPGIAKPNKITTEILTNYFTKSKI